MALAQCFFERRVQLVRRDLALFQVERHQFFVDLHHLIDQRAMRVGDRREIGFAGRIEETIDDALAAVRRQLIGRHSLPNAAWMAASSSGRSTFSASILLTMIEAAQPRFAAQSIMREVIISMPDCA